MEDGHCRLPGRIGNGEGKEGRVLVVHAVELDALIGAEGHEPQTEPRWDLSRERLGGSLDGMLTQYIVLEEDGSVFNDEVATKRLDARLGRGGQGWFITAVATITEESGVVSCVAR